MHADPPPEAQTPHRRRRPRPGLLRRASARRILTPLAWLDAMIGLPGGIILAGLAVTAAFGVISLFFPPLRLSPRWMAAVACLALVVAALLFAAACRVIGRRFPVLAGAAAVGALPVILLYVSIYWPRGR